MGIPRCLLPGTYVPGTWYYYSSMVYSYMFRWHITTTAAAAVAVVVVQRVYGESMCSRCSQDEEHTTRILLTMLYHLYSVVQDHDDERLTHVCIPVQHITFACLLHACTST